MARVAREARGERAESVARPLLMSEKVAVALLSLSLLSSLAREGEWSHGR